MRIGILIHSMTGHTLSVAQRIEKKLREQGVDCRIQRVSAENEEALSSGQAQPRLISAPDPSQYDALILGAPVWGFSLSKVMAAYLKQLPDLSGKKVACFVTQSLSWSFLGGTHAAKQMADACRKAGAFATIAGIVHWRDARRETPIESLALSLARPGGIL